MCSRASEVFGDGLDLVVIDNLLRADNIVTQRTVRRHVDVVLLAKRDQVVLWVEWVTFDLICSLHNNRGNVNHDTPV